MECNRIVIGQICINVKKKRVFHNLLAIEFSLIPPFDRLSEGKVGKTQAKCFSKFSHQPKRNHSTDMQFEKAKNEPGFPRMLFSHLEKPKSPVSTLTPSPSPSLLSKSISNQTIYLINKEAPNYIPQMFKKGNP